MNGPELLIIRFPTDLDQLFEFQQNRFESSFRDKFVLHPSDLILSIIREKKSYSKFLIQFELG